MSILRAILVAVVACISLQAIPLFAVDVLERQFVPAGRALPVRQYIQETAEDVKEALVNFPERVPAGPQVATLRGRQITISDMPVDKSRNRQIYNDIAELQIQINRAIQVALARQKRPILQNKVEVELKELLELLVIAGIRYNQVANFKLFRDQVVEIRQDLRDSYNAYEIANPNNYYMGIRFRLETLSSEIENLLKTLLIR
jgi:hypothetical protein